MKCGARIPEEADFCIECDLPAGEAPEERPGKRPPKALLAAVAVALVVAVTVAIVLCLREPGPGYKTPEQAFEAYSNGMSSHDFEKFLRACPDFYIASSGGEDELWNSFETTYITQYVPVLETYDMVYAATGCTPVGEEELGTVNDNLRSWYGMEGEVTEAASVDYECVKNPLSGDEADASVFTSTSGYAIRYEGKWYYIVSY